MCFYDQYRMQCGCHKWGHFRQHCSKEYQTGKTCGMKLIMNTISKSENCKICTKIQTKEGRIRKEQDRINRWVKEQRGQQRGASIEASQETIEKLYRETDELIFQRNMKISLTEIAPVLPSSTGERLPRLATAANRPSPVAAVNYSNLQTSYPATGGFASKESSQHVATSLEDANYQRGGTKQQKSNNSSPRKQDFPDGKAETSVSSSAKNAEGTFSPVITIQDQLSQREDIPKNIQLEESCHASQGAILSDKWEKSVAVNWKCTCGRTFEDTAVEYFPGAAKALADSTGGVQNIDIERLAGAEGTSFSSTSSSSISKAGSCRSGSLRICNKWSSSSSQVENPLGKIEGTLPPAEKEYILFCKASQKETVLKHANVTKAPCDYSSYHVLHRKHFGKYYSWYKWMYLFDISSVEFVKFHLFWGKNVSISEEDFGKVPSTSTSEYRYMSDTNPPVLKTAVRHFIQHPSHAPKKPCHRLRIPKKLNGKLSLKKEVDSQEGYGLYLQENICWSRVFLIEGIFATCCLIFAVAWCIIHNGGMQDGFAIAGTGIAYLTILLGALQAVSRRN